MRFFISRKKTHIFDTDTGLSRELEKIEVEGNDLYLPTAPNKLVRGIKLDSGIPLQSAAKVPIMITFNVIDNDGDPNDVKLQACIFKVSVSFDQFIVGIQQTMKLSVCSYGTEFCWTFEKPTSLVLSIDIPCQYTTNLQRVLHICYCFAKLYLVLCNKIIL